MIFDLNHRFTSLFKFTYF